MRLRSPQFVGTLNPAVAAVVTPAPPAPTTDPNLFAWWTTDTTLVNGGGFVLGTWTDRSGNSRQFITPNVGGEPIYSATGCNGHPIIGFHSTGFIHTNAITLNQPCSVYMLLRIPAYVANAVLIDGLTQYAFIQLNVPSPRLQLYAGIYACDNLDMPFDNTWHVLTYILNGVSSLICVDSHADTTGNAGTDNPGGVLLGQFSGGGPHISTYDLGGLIISATANDTATRAIHRNWLANYGGI